MRSRTKVLIVDDHPVVRKAISSYLAQHGHLLIVGEATDGCEAVAKARALLPDIVLLDIDLPQMSGLAVTEVLRKELPNIKVLILSMQPQAEHLPRILQSGARGYVSKEAPLEELVKAIETLTAGECYFSPEIAHLALKQFVQGNGNRPHEAELTSREKEILILIAEGFSNKEIANSFNVSRRTVETHRANIMRKLAIHGVAGLIRFALVEGLVPPRDGLAR